jgi:tetratricopeptide (TPR) repeat protein
MEYFLRFTHFMSLKVKACLARPYWIALLFICHQNFALAYIPTAPIEEMFSKKDPKLVLQEIEKQKKDINPTDFLILKSNALILQKNWKEAIEILEPLFNNDPKNVVIANNYSVALWGIGKKDLAKSILEKNLLTNSPAYRNLRKIYLSNAADSYSKALDGKSNPIQVDLLASTKLGTDLEYFAPPPKLPPPPVTETTIASTEKPKDTTAKKNPDLKTENSEKTNRESKKTPDKAPENSDGAAEFEPIAKNIRAWASAWSSKNAKEYLSFYSSNFRPEDKMSYSDWSQQRIQRVTKPGTISVQVQIIKITGTDKKAVAKIYQKYSSTNLKVDVIKFLDFSNEQGKWVITREYNSK